MNSVTRRNRSREEDLEELTQKLKETQEKESKGFNSQIANLCSQILRIKKSMRILVSEEQFKLIGLMMEHAYDMKTGRRDRVVAKYVFEKILKLEPRNPEANYRYAFLFYQDGNWIKAINHFQLAMQNNDSEFPLSDDQITKANLFIGYCSVMLAKESMKLAEELSIESGELMSEGISIDKLSKKLKGMLDSAEFILYTNNDEKLISKEEYEELMLKNSNNELLLDIAASKPFLKNGDREVNISEYNAKLLKRLLLKGAKAEVLSLADLTVYQEEAISDSHNISWENYRQKVRRINQKLVDVGLRKLIKVVPNTTGYIIDHINFHIIQYDAQ